VGSEKGCSDAKSASSQGRSNFISVTLSRQGKFEKNAKAQSRRVMVLISLLQRNVSKGANREITRANNDYLIWHSFWIHRHSSRLSSRSCLAFVRPSLLATYSFSVRYSSSLEMRSGFITFTTTANLSIALLRATGFPAQNWRHTITYAACRF